MKFSKKIFPIIGMVLALCILLSQITFAANVKTPQGAADALNKLGLFKGTENGYELEKGLTRAEAVTMIVRLLGEEKYALDAKLPHPFVDVPSWASPYVGYAFKNNITRGISETAFDANSKVTSQQFLTFVLRVLEYTDGIDFVWNAPEKLAIKAGLISSSSSGEFLRGDMAVICLNALSASYKHTTLPMYKMLVEKNIFTASKYKTVVGQNNNGGLNSGGNTGSSGSSAKPTVPDDKEDSIAPIIPDGAEDSIVPPIEDEIYTLVLGKIEDINSKDDNCFKMDARQSEDGKQIMISLKLDGKVNLSGFDMILKYNPKHFKLHNLDDALDLQIYSAHNEDLGIVSFNYVGIKNIKEPKELLEITFDFIGSEKIEDKILLQAVEIIKIDEKDYDNIINVDYKLSDIDYSIK